MESCFPLAFGGNGFIFRLNIGYVLSDIASITILHNLFKHNSNRSRGILSIQQ
jgi:hypothetical protein